MIVISVYVSLQMVANVSIWTVGVGKLGSLGEITISPYSWEVSLSLISAGTENNTLAIGLSITADCGRMLQVLPSAILMKEKVTVST